jgi:hypothetical protein
VNQKLKRRETIIKSTFKDLNCDGKEKDKINSAFSLVTKNNIFIKTIFVILGDRSKFVRIENVYAHSFGFGLSLLKWTSS